MSDRAPTDHQWTYDEWEQDGQTHTSDHWCQVCGLEWDPRLSEAELPPCSGSKGRNPNSGV